MSDTDFRALLDLYGNIMYWPGDYKSKEILAGLLNRESAARGYENWMAAFRAEVKHETLAS